MLKEKLGSAFAFLQTKSPPLIGVDISSSALKLVELSETGKGSYRLERYAIEPLPRDVVADGNIANLDQVADALRRAHRRRGLEAAGHGRRILCHRGSVRDDLAVASGQRPRPEHRPGRHRRSCHAFL